MRKLIVKTVILTLLSVVVALCGVYFILYFSAPKALASFFKNFGFNETALTYYEKQYEKTEDFNDLVAVCEIIDEHKEPIKAVEYLKLLTESENYFKYEEDKVKVTDYELYNGKYTVALLLTEGGGKASSYATTVARKGYTYFNPFFVLICDSELQLSNDVKSQLKSAINSMMWSSSVKETERAYMERDLKLLTEKAE